MTKTLELSLADSDAPHAVSLRSVRALKAHLGLPTDEAVAQYALARLRDDLSAERHPTVHCERCELAVTPINDRGDSLCPYCHLVL
jgi:hypothetical protein